MKVLIIEDDRGLASVIWRNFQIRGHSTRIASTGEGAILAMVEEWPDVLIMDVNLPDYSAWEILRRMDEESRNRLRIIVISAAPISRKRLDEFRPARALQKPFPISALLHAVEGTQSEDTAAEEEIEIA